MFSTKEEKEEVARNLLSESMAIVPALIDSDVLERAYFLFENLIVLRPDRHEIWTSTHVVDGTIDDLLLRRDGGNHDYKFYLHFRPQGFMEMRKKITSLSVEEAEFLELGEAIFTAVHAQFRVYFEALDDLTQGKFNLVKRIFNETSRNASMLRFLSYDEPNAKGTTLAKGHYDRGTGSAALFATHDGLWVNSPDHLYQYNPNETLIFLGNKAPACSGGICADMDTKEYVGGTLKALRHGVCAPPGLMGRRGAIVMFIHDVSIKLPYD